MAAKEDADHADHAHAPTHAHAPAATAAATLPVRSLLHAGYATPQLRTWQTGALLSRSALVYPVFVTDKRDAVDPIAAMPGQHRYSVDRLTAALAPLVAKGLAAVLLFGVPENITKVHAHTQTVRSVSMSVSVCQGWYLSVSHG
jgi:delta-aminolevulinic acid dehydratase/porphobilinogen synthase